MAKKKTSSNQKAKNESNDIKSDKASRSLELPESLNEDFNSIRDLKNFDKWFFSKYYHAFYSLSVAYSIKNISKSGSIPDLENNDLRGSEEPIKNSIASQQLSHHDNLFKIIAYWYLMKKGDPEPFQILCDTNKARKICEGVFIENWYEFRKKMANYDSKYPNVQVIDLIENSTD